MKLKTVLAAFAAMVGLSVNAQSWTASEVGAGNYVIYNVGSGQFLTAGNAWGTQASITTTGVSGATQVELIANSGNWFIRTGVGGTNNGLENLADAGAVYMDQSRGKQSTWTFTQVATDNGPVYNIISADNHGGGSGAYLTANSGNTIVSDNGTSASAYAQWKLLDAAKVSLLSKIEEYQEVRATVMGFAANTSAYTDEVGAANTLTSAVTAQDEAVNTATTTTEIDDAISAVKAAGNTFLESVIITAGFDITNAWITNPAPNANGNGWTLSADASFDSGNQCAEFWNKSGATIKQTLTNLPKGAYRLRVIALTRTGRVATLSAGTASMNIATVDNSTVNNRTQANTWFNNGNGVNDLNFTLDAATASLEIGLTADNTTADYWMVWRSFNLTYYGDPINLKKAELAAAVAAAQAIDGSTIPTAAKDAIDAAVTANNQAWSTEAEYDAAISAINTAVSTSASAEIVAAYATVIEAKAMYNQTDYTDKDNAKATFKALIDAADATTNLTDLNAAIVNLKAGLTPFISTVTLDENAFFDVTNFFVVNPSVSQNTTGWTIVGTPNGGYSWGVCNYGECEFYNNNFKFYQTLALTPGTWEFGVTGFHRAGNHNTHFYAGDDKILIPGVENTVVNSMAQAKDYFDAGNGKVALKFLVETAGNVEIGINNEDTQTDKWTIFRNFTLKYYGAPDYSVYDQQWNDAVTAANAAKADAANANVTGSELTALDAAIADSPVGSNLKATYTAKINALEDATQTFTAAAPSYDKYVAYKAETEGAWGTDFNVAAPTTAAGALDAIHALNVAQYTKVANDYIYSATGLIGDFGSWDGTATYGTDKTPSTPNYLSNEHWSGQTHAYYEQCAEGWGNAGGWTIKYEKTCTLPAGDYVIKVAARSSGTGVTSEVRCTATTATVTLPAESAFARGIKLNGAAGWDGENSEYARDGEGYGWAWRFLPFSLSAETEVTMTFYAEASSQYQWMSIADGELLSTTKLAQDVAYDEADDNTIENTIIADVTMTRNIKAGFNTVVVPFTLTANQVTDAFGAGTEVYEFSEASSDPNDVTINFNKGDGSITANTPVLVNATEASTEQVFEGVQIVAPTTGAIVMGTNTKFIGVFGPLTVAAGDYFVGRDNSGAAYIYKSAGSTSIKAFRAYIYAQEAASVKMFIGGIATGINEINGAIATEDNAPVFNLAGQRVNKAQKGIYIQNGKKVLVK